MAEFSEAPSCALGHEAAVAAVPVTISDLFPSASVAMVLAANTLRTKHLEAMHDTPTALCDTPKLKTVLFR